MIHRRRPLLPGDILAALESLPAPRWLMTTPLQLRACVQSGCRFPPLEGVVSSTMALPSSLAQQAESLFSTIVHEIYGCTEAGIVGIRQPARERRWTLCEGLHLRQTADGPILSGGHLDREVQLRDVVREIDGRTFELAGRDSDLVKVGGKRASLETLTVELKRIAGVIDAVYFPPEEREGDTGRLAALVVAPGLTEQMILRALRQRIDPVFLPRPLILVAEIPRTTAGKIARDELRAVVRRSRECG
jgi:acyl-coenzyme A synthetase/AMP-(fatty) acid ligase